MKPLERHSMGTPNNSAPYLRSRQGKKIKSRAPGVWRLGAFAAIAVSAWCVAAGAPNLSAQQQTTADVSTYPWSSIGKLNNSIGGSCTAVVIDRTQILTAAHCLFNRRTARFLPASALHFLLGYERGAYSVHALVADYSMGAGYDPNSETTTLSSDWSILRLAEPLPATVRPLQVASNIPEPATKLLIGSYAARRLHLMTEVSDCRVVGFSEGRDLILHNCTAGLGSSGAPLLMLSDRGYVIVGLQVAFQQRASSKIMLAIPTANIPYLHDLGVGQD